MVKKHHKTIVLSDLHLGSKWSKVKSVTRFLKKNSCDTLILCGDIIDGWNIMRGKKVKWKKSHTTFMKLLLDIQHTTHIIYIRGNHDDFLDRVVPIHFQNIDVVKDYTYISNGKSYYVTHGDIFATITSRFSWLAHIGDIGYTALLWINKLYNNYRIKKGLSYYSLSKEIKNKVKVSVSYISDFERHLTEIARKKKCDGIICGHIHHAEINYYDEILYLNSGDWIESLTALTEDYEGNWQIITYEQFEEEQKQEQQKAEKRKTPQLKIAI